MHVEKLWRIGADSIWSCRSQRNGKKTQTACSVHVLLCDPHPFLSSGTWRGIGRTNRGTPPPPSFFAPLRVCTCQDTPDNTCGRNGFDCIDPEAPCMNGDDDTIDLLENCDDVERIGNGECDMNNNNEQCGKRLRDKMFQLRTRIFRSVRLASSSTMRQKLRGELLRERRKKAKMRHGYRRLSRSDKALLYKAI